MNSMQSIFLFCYLGYVIYMSWSISVAVKGGPAWRSGHPGDRYRMSRNSVIAGSIFGMIVGFVLVIAQFIS